jgi:hypothetical protein
MVTATLPASELAKLTRAFRAVAAATQRDARDVVRGFAGVILKTWAGRTKIASPAQAEVRSRSRVVKGLGLTQAPSPGDVSVNAGIRGPFGRVWVRSPKGGFRMAGQISSDGGTFRAMQFHWKQKTWTDISEAVVDVVDRLPKAIRYAKLATGLARQSVIQIADSLAIDLVRVQGGGSLSAAGIAKARSAIASTGRSYKNGLGTEENSTRGIFLTLINNYPLAGRVRMDSTLAGVLSGQIKYFERNIQEGVFLSQAQVARAYPFLQAIP